MQRQGLQDSVTKQWQEEVLNALRAMVAEGEKTTTDVENFRDQQGGMVGVN